MENIDVMIGYCSQDIAIRKEVEKYLNASNKYKFIVHAMDIDCAGQYDVWMRDKINKVKILISILTDYSMDAAGTPSEKRVIKELNMACNSGKGIVGFIITKNPKDTSRVDAHLGPNSNVICSPEQLKDKNIYEEKFIDVLKHVENLATQIIEGVFEPHKIKINNSFYDKPLNFVGREEEFKALDKVFEKSNYAILKGAGGIGKTALAKMYFLSKGDSYDKYFLIDASEGIEQAISNIDFELTNHISDQKRRFEGNIKLLRTLSKKCIFILDNCDNEINPNDLEKIATGMHCRFAITTRPGISGRLHDEHMIEVGPMPKNDLNSLIKYICENNGYELEDVIQDKKDIEDLIKILNGHTLAIELAISVACMTGDNLKNIIANLLKDTNKVFTAHAKTSDESISEQLNKLYNLAKLNDENQKIMNALSLVHPDIGIDQRNLLKLLNIKDANGITYLVKSTFVQREKFIVSLHNLISEIACDNLIQTGKQIDYYPIVSYIINRFYETDNQTSEIRKNVALLEYLVKNRSTFVNKIFKPEHIFLLYMTIADGYDALLDKNLAEIYFQKCLSYIANNKDKLDDKNLATFYESLGKHYSLQPGRDAVKAMTYYQDAMDYNMKLERNDETREQHANIAAQLGILCNDAGHNEMAYKLFTKSLELRQKIVNDGNTSNKAKFNLSRSLLTMANFIIKNNSKDLFSIAETLLINCEKIRREIGIDPKDYSNVVLYNSFGSLYFRSNDSKLAKAVEYFEKVREICDFYYADQSNRLDYLAVYNNLGRTYLMLATLDRKNMTELIGKSKKYLNKLLQICEINKCTDVHFYKEAKEFLDDIDNNPIFKSN